MVFKFVRFLSRKAATRDETRRARTREEVRPPRDQGTEIQSAICPHCGTELSPIPRRKKKCPECGHFVFVRTRSEDGIRLLLTEEQALFHDYYKRLEHHGIDNKVIYNVRQRLAKQFNIIEPFDGDVIWAALNEKLMHSMKAGDWNELKLLYHTEADFLRDTDKPFFRVLQESVRAELRGYEERGASAVEVRGTIGAAYENCNSCNQVKGKRMSVAQALDSMPIPPPDCANGMCRCWYAPIVAQLPWRQPRSSTVDSVPIRRQPPPPSSRDHRRS